MVVEIASYEFDGETPGNINTEDEGILAHTPVQVSNPSEIDVTITPIDLDRVSINTTPSAERSESPVGWEADQVTVSVVDAPIII